MITVAASTALLALAGCAPADEKVQHGERQ